MALPTLLAGEIPDAAKWATILSYACPASARVTVAQNVGPSNTTLQDVTEIVVPVLANATYRFDLDLQYTTTTAADIRFGWTVPAGVALDWSAMGWSTAELFSSVGAFTEVSIPGFGGTGTAAQAWGLVIVGATPGNLQLRASQFASVAVSTTVDPGTALVLRRLS